MNQPDENTVKLQAETVESQSKEQESKEPGANAATKRPEGKKTERSKGSFLVRILGGNFLARETVVRSLPFLLFLTFLGIVYIANTYYAEKMVRINDRTIRELKELRYEHITIKSELMTLSKQSEVVKRLEGTGVKESVVPPEKIFIKSTEGKKQESEWLPKTIKK